MGETTVKFSCTHCGFCCDKVICLPTPYDVIRIVKETGADPYKFLVFITKDDISGVTKNDPTWLEAGGERYLMALKRTAKGCYFLHRTKRTCTAYEHRPMLCRLFPFKLEENKYGVFKGFSLHKNVGCPKERGFDVPTDPLHEIYLEDRKHHEAYNDLVEIFNRWDYPKKRPQDFIELFIETGRLKKRNAPPFPAGMT